MSRIEALNRSVCEKMVCFVELVYKSYKEHFRVQFFWKSQIKGLMSSKSLTRPLYWEPWPFKNWSYNQGPTVYSLPPCVACLGRRLHSISNWWVVLSMGCTVVIIWCKARLVLPLRSWWLFRVKPACCWTSTKISNLCTLGQPHYILYSTSHCRIWKWMLFIQLNYYSSKY